MVFVISCSWVIEEVDIACVGICFEGRNEVAVYGIVISIYPHYPPPNQFAPVLADNGFNVFAFCYH